MATLTSFPPPPPPPPPSAELGSAASSLPDLLDLLPFFFFFLLLFPPAANSSLASLLSIPFPPSPPPPPTPIDDVVILPDASSVGEAVRSLVIECAERALNERGHFALAIPGGSILKMLVGMSSDDGEGPDMSWTTKTTLCYVNHKCVDADDVELSTHAKAHKLFLDEWEGVNVLCPDGTDDGPGEAASYEDRMRALPEDVLPRCVDTGLPVFDLALIGVGDDGHVGSLYPGRDEVKVGDDGPWVLSVDMKSPPSITLSLPVMKNARRSVVAACGVSDKYPKGKSEGMRRAVADGGETIETFPAVGLRGSSTWIMDEAAGSDLGDEYLQRE
uniref:Glucosamine/galactosamine-6-phosphate isomerase domain-containing protein n=1 Tax=Odontella aurita TaxID=265563 RepID=A0A7S4J6S6_9STRA|mmetsp:Transcript_39890/g.120066  ORF Transcript_39890/g.120066 Transcript_39890/m.120066 type:complete len:331 (+) Transcript_39890:716-1708(+)